MRTTLVGGAAEALEEARAATQQVHEAREMMLAAAGRRQHAMAAAQRAGLSIRAIASALGCSPAVVHHAIQAARAAGSGGGEQQHPDETE